MSGVVAIPWHSGVAIGGHTVKPTVECPKCGEDISNSYEPADPSVGIMTGSWYCDLCDEAVYDDGQYDGDGDYE